MSTNSMKFILLLCSYDCQVKAVHLQNGCRFQILSTTSAGILRSKSAPPPPWASLLGRLWKEHPLSSELEGPIFHTDSIDISGIVHDKIRDKSKT